MNVIAITIYNKPDLLFLYLEQLEKSGELENYKLRFHTEEGYDPEENKVIEDFKKRNPNVDTKLYVKQKIDCPITGFHNILSLYPMSAAEADEFVIVGEEDMIPTEDYLRFNRVCYEEYLFKYDRIFAIAHKRRAEAEMNGRGDILIGDYQLTSPSCISVKAIDNYISPYLENELFFSDPIKFNMIRFNNLRIAPHEHTHHDGSLERMMLDNNLFALKPDQCRSMHVGLSGVFCKGNPPQGTLEERVEQWRELIKDGDKLRSLSTIPSDMVVTDPKGPQWENLKLDIERDLAEASTWFYDDKNDFKEYIKCN